VRHHAVEYTSTKLITFIIVSDGLSRANWVAAQNSHPKMTDTAPAVLNIFVIQ
jgi:hypothetical protein